MRVLTKPILCLLAGTLTASAGEYVVLSNGFSIHADSHVNDGAVIRLQTRQGVIEIQASTVAAFEQEDYTPPLPPPPKPTEPAAELQPKLTPHELVTRAAVQVRAPLRQLCIARRQGRVRLSSLMRFRPKAPLGSCSSAPATAAELNADPHDPTQNTEAGARYLRDLLVKYENDPHQVSKAVAAYNAGPGAVDKYKGVPPYRETVDYVNRVLKEYEKEKKKAGATD